MFLQSQSSHLWVDVLSLRQEEPKPWIRTITVKQNLGVVPIGRDATYCIMRITQCHCKSKDIP